VGGLSAHTNATGRIIFSISQSLKVTVSPQGGFLMPFDCLSLYTDMNSFVFLVIFYAYELSPYTFLLFFEVTNVVELEPHRNSKIFVRNWSQSHIV
jgi:hypothetical protein